MPNGEHPTSEEIFNLVIDRLAELKATTMIQEINNTIARGVSTKEESKSSQLFRPMNSEERLSIALEFIVSAFGVPLMLDRSKEILQCSELTWIIDSNEQQDVIDSGLSKSDKQRSIHIKRTELDEPPVVSDSKPLSEENPEKVLSKLVSIIDDLQLQIPEVA